MKPLTVRTPQTSKGKTPSKWASLKPLIVRAPQISEGKSSSEQAVVGLITERPVRMALAAKPPGPFDLDEGVQMPNEASLIWTGLIVESGSFAALFRKVSHQSSRLLNKSLVKVNLVGMEIGVDEFSRFREITIPAHKAMVIDDDSDVIMWLRVTENNRDDAVLLVFCDWDGMVAGEFGA